MHCFEVRQVNLISSFVEFWNGDLSLLVENMEASVYCLSDFVIDKRRFFFFVFCVIGFLFVSICPWSEEIRRTKLHEEVKLFLLFSFSPFIKHRVLFCLSQPPFSWQYGRGCSFICSNIDNRERHFRGKLLRLIFCTIVFG